MLVADGTSGQPLEGAVCYQSYYGDWISPEKGSVLGLLEASNTRLTQVMCQDLQGMWIIMGPAST